MTPVPEAANPLTRNVSTLAQRAPDSRSSCARRRRNDASVAARDALCPSTPAKQRRSLSVGGVSDACSAAPAICRSPAARPRTPTLSAHPPTNPHRTIQRCAQLTVGKGGAQRVARTRSAARGFEKCARSAWRASAMRAQHHQPCSALSRSCRHTHGCRKQLRVSGCHKQPAVAVATRARRLTHFHELRIGCGGQARAKAATPAPCSVSAHVRQPLQQAAPAVTHVCSRTHDLWMRERPIEGCVMDAAPTRGLRRGAGIRQRVRMSEALAQRGEWR